MARKYIDWEINRMSIPEPKVEHHEGRGIRSCPIFPELRPILDEAFEIFGDKSEYVVAAPQYRAAANTAMGWKNSNLRTEMTRLLRRAGVSGWPRLFHSMRASRQTELQREFPLHVVCSWLGNSPRIAQQSYLLVTEDDFAKAAGCSEGDGLSVRWCKELSGDEHPYPISTILTDLSANRDDTTCIAVP
jgi:integrase